MDDTLRRIRAENGIIRIGKMGEIPPAIVEIPIGKIQWGAGRVEIKFHRAGDTGAYLAEHVEIDGSNALWDLSEADLCRKGAGEAQVVWYAEDGHRLKSDIYRVIVDRALEYDAGEPDIWTGVCDRVAGYAGQAERAAESADTSAKSAQAFAAAAAGSAGQASEECARAGQAAQEADQAAVAAAEKARLAEAAAEQAGQAAQAAEQSKAEAENAGTAAENAKTAAQTATEHAETAERSAAASLRRMEEQAGTAAEKLNEAAEAVRKNAEVAEKAAADAGKSAEKAIAAQLSAENAKTDAAESAKGAKDAMAGAEKAAAQANANAEAVAAGQAAQDQKIEALEKAGINDGCISAETPWSSKKIIDMLCPALEESGNPVTCYPVAGYPLGVVANWEPTQAGTGEPYPAGGGPNLLDISKCEADKRSFGLDTAIVGDVLTIKGTVTSTAPSDVSFFSVLDAPDTSLSGKGYKITAFTSKGSIKTIYGLRTETETSIAIGMNLVVGQVVDVALHIMVSKDTPTAYAPYENIRPISGREAVTVERCGENLLKITPFATAVNNGVTFEYVPDGGIRVQGTASTNTDSPTFPIRHLPPGKYYGLDMGTGIAASIVVQRAGKNLWLNAKGTFEIIKGDIVKYWYMIANNGYTANTTVYPYIVPGTTAPTTYAPYQGDTLSLTLPRTIYGGTVDAVTGDGTENVKIITVDGDKIKFTGTGDYWNLPTYSAPGIGAGSVIWCSHFDSKRFIINLRYSFIFTSPGRMTGLFASAAELSAYCAAQYAAGTPVQIAYKLVTPTPIHATGAQPVPALAGCNTVLTDADSTTVTGRADPAHAIAALQAQLATATQQLVETQAAVVDYIYEQDLAEIGLEEVDDSDNQTDTGAADVPGV